MRKEGVIKHPPNDTTHVSELWSLQVSQLQLHQVQLVASVENVAELVGYILDKLSRVSHGRDVATVLQHG